ncbi:abscisic acid-deficient protein Aba4 family protein [Bradyrhizobium sp. 2TAF24]|uniref:abscisic acid-deficient protein Aba4 family protein n=1 Tax=Bradyrhizobium sp. 2TAF24 TaxID=3233011 RepID=UPI003F8F9D38
MLDVHSVIPIATATACAGWLGLIVALFARPALPIARTVATVIIPGLLAVAYVVLFIRGWDALHGVVGALAQLQALLADDATFAAGWLHYLAFDLFVGAWIVHESDQFDLPRWLIVPCLVLTALAGPAGLLAFIVVRAVVPRLIATAP